MYNSHGEERDFKEEGKKLHLFLSINALVQTILAY